ncbi:MAG: hypothetical protein R2695_14875 [Acidimicrobiales bacterium]
MSAATTTRSRSRSPARIHIHFDRGRDRGRRQPFVPPRQPFDDWRAQHLVGTPEQVAAKMQTYIDLGCTAFYPWCSDYPDTETLRLLAGSSCPRCARANG